LRRSKISVASLISVLVTIRFQKYNCISI